MTPSFKKIKNKFDIIFLDGLHTYEQTINDIKNSILTYLNQTMELLLVHDCLPKKIWNQIVPRTIRSLEWGCMESNS